MNYMPSYQSSRRHHPRNGYASVRHANASPLEVQTWKNENPAAAEWLEAAARKDNDFACSLIGSLNRYGRLTDNQLACVERNIARDAARPALMDARLAAAPEVSILAIETAFANAKAAGVGRPALTFAVFKFKPAPKSGRNPGAVYVTDKDTGGYLGMAKEGKFLHSRDCPPDAVPAILATCADPFNAALAYGKQFGVCACCSRTLTDPKSIARGIGPVCATYYGWGA